VSSQPTIETDRLVLRPYADSDAARVLDIHGRLDVIRWLGDPPYVPMNDLDEAVAWIERWAKVHTRDPRLGGWALETKETGVVAGTALLVELPHGDGKVQIGWHLHPDSVGHGYATEAARAVLTTGFANGLPEIWVDMFADNAPSAAVCLRLDLMDLGVIEDPWYGGKSRVFMMTREQWDARFEPTASTP
jgi:RimJ/RimL family protein N-acetyltransferase